MENHIRPKDSFCRTCGAGLSEGFIYCPGCGRTLGGEQAPEGGLSQADASTEEPAALSPDAERVLQQFDAEFEKLRADMQNPLRKGIPFVTRSPFSYARERKAVLWISLALFAVLFGMLLLIYYLMMKFLVPYITSVQGV